MHNRATYHAILKFDQSEICYVLDILRKCTRTLPVRLGNLGPQAYKETQ